MSDDMDMLETLLRKRIEKHEKSRKISEARSDSRDVPGYYGDTYAARINECKVVIKILEIIKQVD